MSGEPRVAAPVPGHLEIITGGMFSGKTEELIRRVRRALIGKQRVAVFKPAIDTRSGANVASHSKQEFPAIIIPTEDPQAILPMVLGVPAIQVVGIEETQFFDVSIIDVVTALTDSGRRVIIAGLDMDAWGKPFGAMPALLAMAERVDKLTAICTLCGKDATRSQKIPTYGGGAVVDVGAADKYEARCRSHFSAPN